MKSAMRSRLSGAGAGNRFGLTWSGEPDNLPSSAARQRQEAWEHVSALARIAKKKHGDIRRGVPWLVVAIAAAGLEIIASVAVNL